MDKADGIHEIAACLEPNAPSPPAHKQECKPCTCTLQALNICFSNPDPHCVNPEPCTGRGIIADADIVVGSPWAPAEARRNQAAAAPTGTGLVPASPLRQPLGGRGAQVWGGVGLRPHTSPLIKARVARRVSAPVAPCAGAGMGVGVLKGSGSSSGLMSQAVQGVGTLSRGVAAGGMARSNAAAAGLARRKSAPGGKNIANERDAEASLLQVRGRGCCDIQGLVNVCWKCCRRWTRWGRGR